MPPPTESPEARFEALFRAHYAAVLRFALRRSDPATAEDVASEVFATCWRRLDAMPAAPLPWLLVTARHELANRGRAAQRAAEKGRRAGVPPPGRDPAEGLAERDAIVRAFLTLAEPDREALRLVAWDDLPVADAARVAGTSRPAFAMRLHRARRRLAAALAAEEAEPAATAPARSAHPSPTHLEPTR